MHFFATETTVVLVFSAATTLAILIPAFVVGLVVFAYVGAGDAARDAQRYIELTQEARVLLPKGRPALSDPGGATSAALDEYLAKKAEARRALWESRDDNDVERPKQAVG
jgi:hypothetical protein